MVTVMTALSSIFGPLDREPGPPCVIAEAGVNHDGSVADAHALIDLAADVGADAVKFQTFDPSALVSATAAPAAYQAANTGVTTQAEMLERLVLPVEVWPELESHALERGLGFLSTPFDTASLDLLCELDMAALKLGSGELTNRTLLMDVGTRGLPVLCSTGMSTMDEVGAAMSWLRAGPTPVPVVLMHCVSSYPAPLRECNLRAMVAMRERFEVPTGWSDHTIGFEAAVAAVALGAVVLEKHLTLDNDRQGPDHKASADGDAFAAYVQAVQGVHAALGNGTKVPTAAEAENVAVVRRSWHAARDLRAGDVVAGADVVGLRPESGVPVSVDVVGRRLLTPVTAGEPLAEASLEQVHAASVEESG